jgi:phosphatidylserine decarboxylase
VGRIADVRLARPLRRPLLGTFARVTGVNLSESDAPLDSYETFNSFFVRRLLPGARTLPADPRVIASPVDGILGQFGTIRDGTLIQAKGRLYSATGILGDADDAVPFDGGTFVTFYLSPHHYHRIHAPCDGSVVMARHIPGALMPVNDAARQLVFDLFPRNERLVCFLEGPQGRFALIAIGAYNVGRISATFDAGWGAPETRGWVTNRKLRDPETRRYPNPRAVTRGSELMAFHVGSAVVLLSEKGRVTLRDELRPGVEIRLGQPIAMPA